MTEPKGPLRSQAVTYLMSNISKIVHDKRRILESHTFHQFATTATIRLKLMSLITAPVGYSGS